MERDQDVLRAASMYYLQDMKMDVIARHLGTSRSTVSRLIKHARRTGMVEITLRPPTNRAPHLGSALAQRFGVEAHVVAQPDQATHMQRLEGVARTTAKLLTTWFDSDMILGIAWGTTLAAISRYLQPKPTRGSSVVQLNGAANTRTTGLDYASDLISAFGSAFTATTHHFLVPAFFDYPSTRDAMWQERSIRRVLDVQDHADIVVFGIGSMYGPIPSHVYAAGYLDEDDMALVQAERVVGDVSTVLLRENGTWRDVALNGRASGPTPDRLVHVPRRVCAVAGDAKVSPLLGALRAHAITHLIIDEITALALLRRVHGLPADTNLGQNLSRR